MKGVIDEIAIDIQQYVYGFDLKAYQYIFLGYFMSLEYYDQMFFTSLLVGAIVLRCIQLTHM